MKKREMKHRILAVLFAAGCFFSMSGLSASAVTVDDIANKARELGFPEAQVQEGYNMWSTGAYTQEDLDKIWAELENFEGDILDLYEKFFMYGIEGLPQQPTTDPVKPTEGTTGATDAPTEGTQAPEAPTQAPEATEAPTQAPTKEFAEMTFEEMRAYVSGMTPEERRTFFENLTPEERKNILKKMPIDNKAEVMEGFLGVAEEMGMHVTVDKLTDDNISLTIRDDQGTIVDKSEMGITIDETGISHTGLLVSAAAGAILALSGLAVLSRKMGNDESTK
ncbi:MAG: hypothetical protein IKK51_06350 [Oscillospiraceae bacterium]|nr:hypothetical protein [Oscillospiraceae bacterium]